MMKMIRAIIRPEDHPSREGSRGSGAQANDRLPAMTKRDVLGRGKQQGAQAGDHFYDEQAKCMFQVYVRGGGFRRKSLRIS